MHFSPETAFTFSLIAFYPSLCVCACVIEIFNSSIRSTGLKRSETFLINYLGLILEMIGNVKLNLKHQSRKHLYAGIAVSLGVIRCLVF